MDWYRVIPVMSSPEAFLHYYYSTEAGRSAQVVRLLTENAGKYVFVVSVFILGPSN